MENKKFNKIIEEELYCNNDEKFVVQCNSSDIKESADYKTALELLKEHLKELHTENSTVQLIERIPLKVNRLEVGRIDVPLASYYVTVEKIKNPRKEVEKVWNDYLDAFFVGGRYGVEAFTLRIKLFDLIVKDKDIIEKKIRQDIGGK